jgi:hypothetical protein
VPALFVVVLIGAAEGALARRDRLDDHCRHTAAVYMTAARNYARYGFLVEGAAPLANGGAYELAREGRYLNWPVRDFLELGLWFEVFGDGVRVARAQTVFWAILALAALAWGGPALARLRGSSAADAASAALLPLVLGVTPFFIYYAHAACPQSVTVAAVAIAAAARLRRLDGGGWASLAVQGAAVLVAVSTNWEGLLFPLAWAAFDLRRGRRDGLLLAALALAVVGLEAGYIVLEGGTRAWLEKASLRAGSPGPAWRSIVRVVRYGRSLGYGHVLLALAWAAHASRRWRRGATLATDRVALELLLAPLPWFVVFREHVVVHDCEMFYFAPGVTVAATLAVLELSERSRGRARAALAVLMLVATGSWIGGVIEHRDDLTFPRALGEAARETTRPDQAVATNTTEFSVAWEADRFVHFEVQSMEELDRLRRLPRTAPVRFLLCDPQDPEVAPGDRAAFEELRRRLSERFRCESRGRVLVFSLE